MLSITTLLTIEEGYRESPYYCTEGFPTIGIGQRIGPYNAPLDLYQFKVTKAVAQQWLMDGINAIDDDLAHRFFWYRRLNQARKDILISMCYQLGIVGFCDFKKTIKYLSDGRFQEASIEMLDSKWNKQTPARALRHSAVMASGEYGSVPLYNSID